MEGGGGLFSLRNKSIGGSKRIKISRACDECRKRKVKCDGVQPCNRCRRSNTECVFAKLPPKRGPPKQYMENLEHRLQRVESALKNLTTPVQKILDDALIGRPMFEHTHELCHDDTQSDISDSLTELPLPEELTTSRQFMIEVQGLTDIYFEHVHKYMPMIHKPSFLKQMHSMTNPPSRLLLLSMCAVASRWVVNTDARPGYDYYQLAYELLDDFLDAPRLSTIQALLLLVKYQESLPRNGYFHRAYMYLGMAVSMCHDLGLPQMIEETHDAETRRRTFWVAFVYDLLMSIEQGRTTYFDVHQCTIGFPSVTSEEGPALEELITNQNILIQLGKVLSDIYSMARRTTQRQQSQGYQRSDQQTIQEQARLFSLHTHLENFLYEVPPPLMYSPTQDIENYPVERQAIGDPFIGFLHMTYHFSVILLHRIYMNQPPLKTEFDFLDYPHRKLCATSASNITGIAETLYEMYPVEILCYPTRGVQHTIHCLSMAATVHKYEMAHADDEFMCDKARYQYMVSVDLIQKISSQSPSIEFSKYYHRPSTAEKRMSAALANVPEPRKMRRNTLSTMSEASLYPQFMMPSFTVQWQNEFPIQSWNQQQPQQHQQQHYQEATQAPLGPDMVVVREEDMMMNPHYDPSSGMSQLFLTDNHFFE
ncbi:hypothetical protein CU098_006704 [Rhizopus stolonifer]|uniref:Zn(2)-C6 fungal-type domain-containing protein n=1 Tax=Rhizopus stolonifer TaxID=4846 RepID=A0A367JC60_RHIST|nr:hypothetical protein CU098_006704 [Rhizopus stolonifer]